VLSAQECIARICDDLQSECGELFARIFPPVSRLCGRWFSLEREIRWRRADGNGAFGEDNWAELRYTGRTTIFLKTQLVNLLPPNLYRRYTLCVRAGRYGQPTPLAVNLPRSREPLYIVLFGGNTAGQSVTVLIRRRCFCTSEVYAFLQFWIQKLLMVLSFALFLLVHVCFNLSEIVK
jgi:hypothetical protein